MTNHPFAMSVAVEDREVEGQMCFDSARLRSLRSARTVLFQMFH